jgi:hypothetical protein
MPVRVEVGGRGEKMRKEGEDKVEETGSGKEK